MPQISASVFSNILIMKFDYFECESRSLCLYYPKLSNPTFLDEQAGNNHLTFESHHLWADSNVQLGDMGRTDHTSHELEVRTASAPLNLPMTASISSQTLAA